MRVVLAHGLGGRSDLPVPLWLALYGGGAAVVVSFTALGAFWREPRLEIDEPRWPLPEVLQRVVDARVTRWTLRALGVLMLAALVTSAALGTDSSASNPAPTWLYVWFWVGLVPASLVLGPVWRLLNPLRAISVGLALLSGRAPDEAPRPLPERLGYWPAAMSLTAFTWLELVFGRSDEPLVVLVFVAAYSLAHIAAAQTYGRAWYERGDGFEVYSTLVGHLSPLLRDSDGRLAVTNPLRNLTTLRVEPGLLGVICVLLGSTAFDGLSRTQPWLDLTQGRSEALSLLLGTAGLAGAIGFVALTYMSATKLSESFRAEARADVTPLRSSFLHSLVPIIVGYTLAHYFSFFVFQGQAGYILASDPLGNGSDLFGTADWTINYLAVSTRTIALVQVLAIVAAHVVAVVAAHDRAMELFPERAQTRGQYALLAVMVTYTVGGIALLVGT